MKNIEVISLPSGVSFHIQRGHQNIFMHDDTSLPNNSTVTYYKNKGFPLSLLQQIKHKPIWVSPAFLSPAAFENQVWATQWKHQGKVATSSIYVMDVPLDLSFNSNMYF